MQYMPKFYFVFCLVPVEGTPMEKQPLIPVEQLAQMIATARIVMPQSMVRLSAGRVRLSVAGEWCTCRFVSGIFLPNKASGLGVGWV